MYEKDMVDGLRRPLTKSMCLCVCVCVCVCITVGKLHPLLHDLPFSNFKF